MVDNQEKVQSKLWFKMLLLWILWITFRHHPNISLQPLKLYKTGCLTFVIQKQRTNKFNVILLESWGFLIKRYFISWVKIPIIKKNILVCVLHLNHQTCIFHFQKVSMIIYLRNK